MFNSDKTPEMILKQKEIEPIRQWQDTNKHHSVFSSVMKLNPSIPG